MSIYLDNAATSFPKPNRVIKAVDECIREYCGNAGRSGHPLSNKSAEQIYACRCEICSFFHYAIPERVVFTKNASEAINLAVHAYYSTNCHVLYSDLEHNSVRRKILSLCKQGKVRADMFSHKGDVIENIKNLTTSDTRMLVCTEASNVSGFCMPIKEISDYCKENEIELIIDGAQGAGHCEIDLSSLYFSAYCASAHKGLYGIQGLGFAIMEKEPKREFLYGGTGFDSFSDSMPEFMPEKFEAGTLPTPSIVALKEGLLFLKDHRSELEQAINLADRFYENLNNMDDICTYSVEHNACAIVSFLSKSKPTDYIAQKLSERGIYTRSGYHCAPTAHIALGTEKTGLIRASFGLFNSEREVKRATDAVYLTLHSL